MMKAREKDIPSHENSSFNAVQREQSQNEEQQRQSDLDFLLRRPNYCNGTQPCPKMQEAKNLQCTDMSGSSSELEIEPAIKAFFSQGRANNDDGKTRCLCKAEVLGKYGDNREPKLLVIQ